MHKMLYTKNAGVVCWFVHFQQNDAEWIFSLQGGGMRRSGGYVD